MCLRVPSLAGVLREDELLFLISSFAFIHRTHSMTVRCFISQPFFMEKHGNQAMLAAGSFEEWDAFREA